MLISKMGQGACQFLFCLNGGQYFIDDCLQPITPWITQDARPTILDTALMLIFHQVYPQYAIIWFGIVYHSHYLDSLFDVFMYFLLDHYIVLW